MNKVKKITDSLGQYLENFLNKLNLGMRAKLLIIFLVVKIIPLILLAVIAWHQIIGLGSILREIAVNDSTAALNASATENIERMSTDTAQRVAEFLYSRDDDILYVAGIDPSEGNYRQFVESKLGRLVKKGEWNLSPDEKSWVAAEKSTSGETGGISSNSENNDMNGFHYRKPETFDYEYVPLYDEITFIDLHGNEIVKYDTALTTKVNYPLDPQRKNVAQRENTYVKAETYFDELRDLEPGEIYVSDVIGAYVGSNYIGMYTPKTVAEAVQTRGYDIEYDPAQQAYAGAENPNGKRFEGIVRWATPVTNDSGDIIGYVTLALNHDHIMEFVDHLTPMEERYRELPSAYEGNYAFIWDYQCRSICHPRHHSIVGFDPETGDPQVPWLEASIYDAWQASGIQKWTDYIKTQKPFDAQSRDKAPAPALTKEGFIGLDGRYLNNAPQCAGWMDLTEDGGSGSFYILWSGLYKLTTAAAIPYYTGHYAPSESNDYSKRGFGFVAIGAGLEDFTHPATETEQKLEATIETSLKSTLLQLIGTTAIIVVLVVFIAIWMASFLTNNITRLIKGLSRFRAGERQFRFNSLVKDEFGTLADSFDDMANSIEASVNSPLCITDMDRNIIYMNDIGLEICKKNLAEIVGTPYSESSVYPADSKFCPITALKEGHESEVYYIEESKQYVKGVANYFLDKDGKKIGYIIVSTDVTEIQDARKKAEQASKAKSEFLSNMSHEMRTPMNAIIGMTSIGKAASDLERKDYTLNKIDEASKHLLGVINDILDMSKIEANKFDISLTEFNFEKMLQKVTNVIHFRMDEKQQNFTINVDKNIPNTLIGDDQRLVQVITNLLSNAVKFTPEQGSVRLDADLIKKGNGVCTIQVKVTDTGIGIDEEQQARIFTSFEQAESSTSRKFGGTGLGLPISKHIVESMGGQIWVESEIGKGSSFIFTISTGYSEDKDNDLGKDAAILEDDAFNQVTNCFEGYRVLLAEDVELNREIVLAILEPTALAIDCAENGAEAVKMFGEAPERYDMIFMDVQMPKMDGYEATRSIRALDIPEAKSIPIIAMTANVFREDVEKCLAVGMNDHVGKPLDFGEVLSKLHKYLPQK